MGHEMIAFTHYYIVENGESFYLHAGESVPIKNYEVPRVHHNYKETSDDKADWNRLMNAIANGISSGEMTKVVPLARWNSLAKHHIMWQVSWLIW